jgi:hypothetical protein
MDDGVEQGSVMVSAFEEMSTSVRAFKIRELPPQHLRDDSASTSQPAMATTRISAPLRGVSQQLSRLSIRQTALPARCMVSCAVERLHAPF